MRWGQNMIFTCSNPYHYGVWSWVLTLFASSVFRGRVKFTPWKHGEITSMSKCISPHIFLLAGDKILMDNGAAPKPGHSEWKRASRFFFRCARLASPFVLSIFAPPSTDPVRWTLNRPFALWWSSPIRCIWQFSRICRLRPLSCRTWECVVADAQAGTVYFWNGFCF